MNLENCSFPLPLFDGHRISTRSIHFSSASENVTQTRKPVDETMSNFQLCDRLYSIFLRFWGTNGRKSILPNVISNLHASQQSNETENSFYQSIPTMSKTNAPALNCNETTISSSMLFSFNISSPILELLICIKGRPCLYDINLSRKQSIKIRHMITYGAPVVDLKSSPSAHSNQNSIYKTILQTLSAHWKNGIAELQPFSLITFTSVQETELLSRCHTFLPIHH